MCNLVNNIKKQNRNRLPDAENRLAAVRGKKGKGLGER